jgi:hypothetical protein
VQKFARVGVLIAVVVVSGMLGGSGRAGAAHGQPVRVDGTAAIVNLLGRPTVRNTALPSWNGSFSLGGATYLYTMLGTDPGRGSRTTALRVDLIPLRLTFKDGGITLDGTETVPSVVGSPIFQRADYRSGHSQYADAMQRAEFWTDVQGRSPGYHVLVAQPKVLPTTSLQVPVGAGAAFATAHGPAGFVTTSFLVSLLPRVSAFYDPDAVLVFLTKDVEGDAFLGFHFAFTPAGRSVPQTLIFTGVFTPNVLVAPDQSDVAVLSHEVAEWINDPYVSNVVPAWQAPGIGGCFSNLLEVGDPVEFLPNSTFEVTTRATTYHVTDVAGVSWFAHDVPSRELGGAYSYNRTLTTFSTLC